MRTYKTRGFNAVLTVLYFMQGRPATYAEFVTAYRAIFGRHAARFDMPIGMFVV